MQQPNGVTVLTLSRSVRGLTKELVRELQNEKGLG
jgi:hypothetical protein